MKMKHGSENITMDVAVSYQKPDGLLFPQSMDINGIISSVEYMQQKITMNAAFENCKVTR